MEVPQELSELRQWIVWRDEDGRKIPYQIGGDKARSNDPTTWSTLEEAQRVAPGFSGLGFVFAQGGGLWGMDLDGCRDPSTGSLAEWAECILNDLSSYSEVSPSGTGVKIWGRGQFGAGRRITVDEEHVCSKAPAIEVYSFGRYFTFTGQRVGSWGIRTVDPGKVLAAFDPAPSPPAPFFSPDRPRLYVASVPGCGEGNRNHTAFRLAACLLNDFALDSASAWPLLCSWNDRNSPPLKEGELKACFSSAGRNAKHPRGEKLQERAEVSVDLSRILTPKGSAPGDPGAFPDECLNVPGLIGDVMEYNLRTAMYPQPALAMAGALTLLAVLTGRKVVDERGTRTNLYALGLAPSGSGKEHARAVNKNLLIRASSEGEKMIGPERIGSSAGLVAAVHSQPAVLFHIDEFGKMLATMRNAAKSPHLYNIASVLMQLYSSSGTIWIADAYADLKKTKRIIQPHACVYGTGTPEDFWAGLTKENVSDGLLGRLMVFEGGYVRRQAPATPEAPTEILERIRKWLEFRPSGAGNLDTTPKQVCVSLSPGAKSRLDEHLDSICERRERETPTTAAVWSRSGEKTAKLALLFACSRWDGEAEPCVEFDDVDRAVRIINWLTRKMIRQAFEHVSENDNEARSKKLMRLIDGEMTINELTRKSQWLRARERQEILADLEACGYITSERRDTGGRPVTYIKKSA